MSPSSMITRALLLRTTQALLMIICTSNERISLVEHTRNQNNERSTVHATSASCAHITGIGVVGVCLGF